MIETFTAQWIPTIGHIWQKQQLRFPLLFLNHLFLLLSESLIRTAANEIKIPVVLSLKSNPDLCRIPERFYFSTNMIETSEVVIFCCCLNSEIVLREHFIFVFYLTDFSHILAKK